MPNKAYKCLSKLLIDEILIEKLEMRKEIRDFQAQPNLLFFLARFFH
jgi:hypothetical protein